MNNIKGQRNIPSPRGKYAKLFSNFEINLEDFGHSLRKIRSKLHISRPFVYIFAWSNSPSTEFCSLFPYPARHFVRACRHKYLGFSKSYISCSTYCQGL